ncbi:MAG: BolA family protein [Prochlorotrichaceae cyanobacterium]
MVALAQVENLIKSHIEDSQVFVEDLTGGGDHLQVTVVSPLFQGKTRVKQHQMVYGAVQGEMASEAIHALALKTFTPEEWQQAQ